MSYVHVQRLQPIYEEYLAVRASVDYAAERWSIIHDDEIFVGFNTKFSQIQSARQNIEATYTVRIFSEFESILRQEMRFQGHKVPYKTEALINRAALISRVSNAVRLEAHRVREYRNDIVHQNAQRGPVIPLLRTMTSLNKFLAGL